MCKNLFNALWTNIEIIIWLNTVNIVLHQNKDTKDVTCQLSRVTCLLFFLNYFFVYFFVISVVKTVEVVGGGSVINGAYPVLYLGWFPDSIWSFDDSNKVQVYFDESLGTSRGTLLCVGISKLLCNRRGNV